MQLAAYEEDILTEIRTWESTPRQRGLLGKAGRVASKPFDWALSTDLAQRGLERISDSVYATLTKLHQVANRTFSAEATFERLRKTGAEVSSLADIREADIRLLDQVAQSSNSSHAIMAGLEGGGLGLGGLYLIAADVPALLTLNFRMIQQIATSYGYDPTPEYEVDVALKIIQVASESGSERRDTLLELEAALEAVRAGTAKLGMFAGVLALQMFSRRLSQVIAKRKLGQLVPLVGIGIGAGVNYQFTHDIGETAYMVYRKRFLLDKKARQA